MTSPTDIKQSISLSSRRMAQAFSTLKRGEMILIRGTNNRAALLRAAEFADYDQGQMSQIAASGTLLCLRRQHVEALGRKATGKRPVFSTPVDHLDHDAIFAITYGKSHDLPANLSFLGEADESLAHLATRVLKQAKLLPTALISCLTSDDPQYHNQLANIYALPIVNAFDAEHHDSTAQWQMTKGAVADLPLAAAPETKIVMFRSENGEENHFAIVVASGTDQNTPLVRIHSQCITGDILGSLKCDCGPQLQTAIARMHEAGGGVLLYLAQEGRDIGLMNKIRAYALQDDGYDTVDANHRLGFATDERVFIPAAVMLRELSITSIKLMTNNPDKVEQLSRFGITVTERVPLILPSNPHNERYLEVKKQRTGHLFDQE